MKITPSDTDPTKVVVTISSKALSVVAKGGRVIPWDLPDGAVLTISEEMTYEQLVNAMLELNSEIVAASLAEARKRPDCN